jgi:hypothetical protein
MCCRPKRSSFRPVCGSDALVAGAFETCHDMSGVAGINQLFQDKRDNNRLRPGLGVNIDS